MQKQQKWKKKWLYQLALILMVFKLEINSDISMSGKSITVQFTMLAQSNPKMV